jgi:hypothetical protein
MAAATTLAWASLGASVLGAGMGAVGAIQQGKAAKAQGNYQAQVAANNQVIAERAAQDALDRGKQAEAQQRLKGRQIIGAQRAALAANGVLVDEGTAGQITEDQAGINEVDALNTRVNAEREAYNYRLQGANAGNEGQLALIKGRNAEDAAFFNATGSILGGAGSVADKWYRYDKAGAFA